MEEYICPICGNRDVRKIGIRNGKPYCRACLTFRGSLAGASNPIPKRYDLCLSYPLSEEQAQCSFKVLKAYCDNKDTLIYAVCGAGKTELVFKTIQYVLKNGGSVGFCVPRRDVVIEIASRLKEAFRYNKVISVYGGHSDKLEGDIICLTSHQLYRYENYFDLLIMDEIDAFPFSNNETLNSLFFKSIKGHYIKMSATPSQEILDYFNREGKEVVTLFSRFHRHYLPLPEPVFKDKGLKFIYLLKYLKEFLKEDKQVFIFVPTIDESKSLFNKLKIVFKGGEYVSSKRENREEIIQKFKDKKIKYLVTTSILERGVTVDNLQVIVYDADNYIYNDQTLIQIAGRAGRKIKHPEGRVIFISEKKTESIFRAIEEISHNNLNLQNMF